ncbi:MAG: DUF4367 domain-containing protein [Oscillospiraceae bacterium]|nr:DUF4367 domain-containing protein [Oscillospiraceae bacterium]
MNNFKTALENVIQKDLGRYENAAEHEFSAEFEKKMAALSKRVSGGKRSKRMRIGRIIAAAAAAVVLFAMGTLAGAVSSGFNVVQSKRWGLPSKLFTAADTEGCPMTIETVYVLDGFPMNRFGISESGDGTSVLSKYYSAPYEEYLNDEMYSLKTIFLEQETKETFKFKYTDMEYVTYKQLTVNGGQAYFITRERYYGMEAYLIWESEDYIFTLSGSFSEERALELAGSLAVYDGEIPFYVKMEV